jgi:hypothetical protein
VSAYQFYIANNRSSALGFRVANVSDLRHARQIAANILKESPAHTGVEVRQDSCRLFAIGSLAECLLPGGRARSTTGARSAAWRRSAL